MLRLMDRPSGGIAYFSGSADEIDKLLLKRKEESACTQWPKKVELPSQYVIRVRYSMNEDAIDFNEVAIATHAGVPAQSDKSWILLGDTEKTGESPYGQRGQFKRFFLSEGCLADVRERLLQFEEAPVVSRLSSSGPDAFDDADDAQFETEHDMDRQIDRPWDAIDPDESET